MSSKSKYDIVIIGSGISGLSAADSLRKSHPKLSLLVIDKAKGPGGRLATRRIDNATLDHGAQFFSDYSVEFKEHLEKSFSKLLFDWPHISDKEAKQYKVINKGMTKWPKNWVDLLSPVVDFKFSSKVNSVNYTDGLWQLSIEGSETLSAKFIISSVPVPQAIDIFNDVVEDDDIQKLSKVDYWPCLVLLITLKNQIKLSQLTNGFYKNESENAAISWIADNQAKGISPLQLALTIHASGQWSQAHYLHLDSDVEARLLDELKKILPELNRSEIDSIQVKRWKYALAKSSDLQSKESPYFIPQSMQKLMFIGDAFHSPRVEGAFLSGLAGAKKLSELIGVES